MPPPLALFLTIAFAVFLLRRDFREKPNVTGALWLPLIWTLLIGSRSLLQWLSVMGVRGLQMSSAEEGNPMDAVVYFALIAAAFYVLNKRRIALSEIFRSNPWLMAFLLYCLLSLAWSDFPFIGFKRWIKALGHPAMALILLTEPDPEEAVTRLLKRSAYVLIPFSILFIKYFPNIGRTWDEFTGIASNCGVNLTKNGLGGGCMIFGFFFFWHLLRTWKSERGMARRNELLLIGGFLLMIAYLLRKAHCATCFLCLLSAIGVTVLLGRHWVNKRLILVYAILIVVTLGVAELAFGIFEYVIDLTGHGSTIAGRADLWRDLLAIPNNPIFGAGFESFWLGERLQKIWEKDWWHPTQAHNGYLEIYLNLGLVGLSFLLGLIISTFAKIRLELLSNLDWGRFRLSLLVAIVLRNWTEAGFRGLGLSWFVFFIIAMEYPNRRFAFRGTTSIATGAEDEMEFAFPDRGHSRT